MCHKEDLGLSSFITVAMAIGSIKYDRPMAITGQVSSIQINIMQAATFIYRSIPVSEWCCINVRENMGDDTACWEHLFSMKGRLRSTGQYLFFSIQKIWTKCSLKNSVG